MNKIIYYCDRCKRQFKRDNNMMNNREYSITDFQGDDLDICPSCYVKFKYWFTKGDDEE